MVVSTVRPGVVPPLVTFFDAAGRPDPVAMATLVDHQIAAGVDGLLTIGSTGELGSLDADARSAAITSVVSASAGRVPVWAGVCGLGTAEAVRNAAAAEADGADALLVLQPLFFDCSDRELIDHFTTVQKAVSLPVLAYNVPGRTPRALPNDVLVELVADGVLAGVKDSSGDLATGRLLVEALHSSPETLVFAGGEITIDTVLDLGFDGTVPGFANILPDPAVAIWRAHQQGHRDRATAAQQVYLDLFEILRVPLPGAGFPGQAIAAIKVATAYVLGLPVPSSAAPLSQPDAEYAAAIAAVVDKARARWTSTNAPN